MHLRHVVPWWAKMGIKMVLSRLPVPYDLWRRLGIFKHGDMQRPDHALRVFETHWSRAGGARRFQPGFVAMEIGPGDSLLSGVVAAAFGASRTYLVDTGHYAGYEVTPYYEMVRLLQERRMVVPQIEDIHSVEDILRACRITYLSEGAVSLSRIPDNSVDFVWSHVVLEHIWKHEFERMCQELHRVMRPTGIVSHAIDLRDHLGGGLNHLRFSEKAWESKLMASSGFYTNRFRMSEILEIFRRVGFEPHVERTQRWQALPTPRAKFSLPYREMSEDELAVAEFDVLLEVK